MATHPQKKAREDDPRDTDVDYIDSLMDRYKVGTRVKHQGNIVRLRAVVALQQARLTEHGPCPKGKPGLAHEIYFAATKGGLLKDSPEIRAAETKLKKEAKSQLDRSTALPDGKRTVRQESDDKARERESDEHKVERRAGNAKRSKECTDRKGKGCSHDLVEEKVEDDGTKRTKFARIDKPKAPGSNKGGNHN